jgi:hypothetical protein
MSYCFDLSGFQGLSVGVVIKYRQDWDTFNRIQAYNSNVSTLRGESQGAGLTYYTYASGDEKVSFVNGQVLHARRYPGINWNAVEKN